ncbi:LPS export ABC transporter periplasmic protein LptC [bacterium]|nr:LPS export ABC transporter periplasmic protein LptC [bacterium]MBL7052152.1 LPS export ABC transporter periplasmic protein LptC [Candidatus Neomarinimicrobiota bacterium]
MAQNKIWVFACIALIIACRQQTEVHEPENSALIPKMESWESKISVSTEGRLNVVVSAGHTFQYPEDPIINFEDEISVDFYDQKNGHISNLIANTATLNKQTNDMYAFGNIFVKTDSGLVLLTTSLFFDSQQEWIYTKDSVEFRTTKDTLWGVGFESDVNLENWKIEMPTGKFKQD